MRRSIVALVLIAIALVGYLAWPVYTMARLARAVEARDVATVVAHVNLPAVHRSVAEQVLETYLKLTGKTAGPLARGVVASAVGNIADPIVVRIVGPEPLTDFLRTGWPSSVLTEPPPPGTGGFTPADLGSAWRIYRMSDYGIRRFEIELPQTQPRERRFRLEFQIVSWRWRLTGISLPEHLRVRLAEALMTALGQR